MITRFSQIEVETDEEAIMFSQNDIYSESGNATICMPLDQFAIIAKQFLDEMDARKIKK